MDDFYDWLFGTVSGGLVLTFGITALILAPFAIASGRFAKEKHEWLKTKGCQQIGEWKTGKRKYCGKACWRDEKITLYECADGRRWEVDGRYLAGVKKEGE